MHGEMLHVQAEYARLLESIEKFNESLNKDFARLDAAKNRIKEATEEAKTAAKEAEAVAAAKQYHAAHLSSKKYSNLTFLSIMTIVCVGLVSFVGDIADDEVAGGVL